jgi:hypothetical protein
MNEPEVKEWFKVSHSANGKTSVTCSLQSGNLSVKWAVQCVMSSIQTGVKQSRDGAYRALEDLRKAVAEVSDGAA